MKLKSDYYFQPTLKVSKDLIGKFLVHKTLKKTYSAEIVETEAYFGFNDKASHASRGKTKRNSVMFGPGGFTYIYLIYGMYYCLNLVTEREGFPAAVLIRGLNYPKADGPGKLCREFRINKNHNGLNLEGNILWAEDRGLKPKVVLGKRIGVDYAKECANWPWRFEKA